jgi:hypothetical protein
MSSFDGPEERLDSEINYTKEAFLHQYNIITLAGMTGLSLFVPGVFFMTMAAELMYLAMVPSNARFQRSVRAELNSASLSQVEEHESQILAKLPQRSKVRYYDLVAICSKIREVVETVDSTSRVMIDQDIEKLDYLLKTFLRMLSALTRQRDHLASVDSNSIERNIRRLEKELETAKPRVKVIKQRNIDILHQRISRIARVEEDQELILANLETIEDTLKLIRDNVVSLNNPEGISGQIEGVVANMQENEKLMATMTDFLGESEVAAAAKFDMDNMMPEYSSPNSESNLDRETVIRID